MTKVRPPRYRLDDSLGYLVNRASRTIRRYLNRELQRRRFELTGEQFAVLVHIWNQGGRTQQQLGSELSKEKTTMTRMLDGLERRGLIRRLAGSPDARQRRIFLTPQGEETMKGLTALAAEVLVTAQKEITPGDLETCKKVLRQVQRTLSQRLEQSEKTKLAEEIP
jgi:DNA-binding MarR family transcriptional regulator